MLLKVIIYYLGVLVVLLAGLAFGAVLLFFVQGTNIISDRGDREFTQIILFCLPFIAALIAIPKAIKKFENKRST